ncbi:pyrroline-5-carboxylate reductase [Bacillus sp. 2205SS5-2]|uniref:pyrroline-5-carboxylate reductase n=1 Tax=Bacillus sp. 2205SS5-2 TaxID=3109031 RepID=UPI0030055AA3
MLKNKKVAFIGAGSMAEAMISGIVESKKIPSINVIASNRSNQDRLMELNEKYHIRTTPSSELKLSGVDIIVLAMKPKDAEKALASIQHSIQPHHLVLSVLAGISTSYLESFLPMGQQVIRVMPNTSSMMRESATAMSLGTNVDEESIKASKSLLACIGEVYVIPEKQMDIFTGIAGSGPAYFYYLMEHIEKAGAEAGLEGELAREIGAQTILGAAKMIMNQDDSPATLRKKVTSPNGTTAAGLAALRKHGGGNAISQAVKGAANRSKELSAELQREPVLAR